ncbi:PIN domain-containing protein [Flavobacterium sp. CFBP9031]|jgi:predicted nucleic acid-binding protein|uniref:PIN domain-containing protein n=1 Tax=Flavobacterium sp. CFBP9031 TaxID=3096538 RepID=UPI002A6B8BAE|nr:PIN domain-containing protein [Flavobacterium sp. CFBP9031]MDY0989181.1 PIN domain-containing protein [Flavobacterium sp. CFBP9031]
MKVLLDTNIIIHREANKIYKPEIGQLFKWIDNLKYSKYIHPLTVEELKRYQDPNALDTMSIKIESYNLLKHQAPLGEEILKISKRVDNQENDINDTQILNEVYEGRVDILISEDKKIHTKANLLGISNRVFRIQTFLEKVISENPELIDYKVLAVKRVDFADVDIKDEFFDSFREDYAEFDNWFNKKSDDICYVCFSEDNLTAFLFIKTEGINENYAEINPVFEKKKRLKIGTFKVTANGYKIGERFLKIIFDNALQSRVDEIYVTIFDKREEQERLIELLKVWGFCYFGIKTTQNGDEQVYVRSFNKELINTDNPKLTFPFFSREQNIFLVPIYPKYHTELFPDSILNNQSPKDFIENYPHRNALSKVYISRSYLKNLKSGDVIVFYMTGGKYKGVATTLGIVESSILEIENEKEFISLCRKRSVFTNQELSEHWNYNKADRPFVVNFLYTYSFRKRPNLEWLVNNRIISSYDNVPRGFSKITVEQFDKLLRYAY